MTYAELQELVHGQLVAMEAYFGTLEDFQGQIGAVPRGITDLAGLYWMSTIPIDNSPETQEVYKQYQSLLDTGFLDVT